MVCINSNFRHITADATELDAGEIETLNAKIEAMDLELNAELKSQKLADKEGKLGWKLVKEYEGPDL